MRVQEWFEWGEAECRMQSDEGGGGGEGVPAKQSTENTTRSVTCVARVKCDVGDSALHSLHVESLKPCLVPLHGLMSFLGT